MHGTADLLATIAPRSILETVAGAVPGVEPITMGNVSSYAAAIRIICFIDGEATDAEVDVFVFESEGWDAAFARALELGRGLERSYRNVAGEHVEWRTAKIETLDELRGNPDVREVYSYRVEVRTDELDPNSLDPSTSRPGPSGV